MMSKRVVKTETFTITRVQEVSVLDHEEKASQASKATLMAYFFMVVKFFLGKWIRNQDDG